MSLHEYFDPPACEATHDQLRGPGAYRRVMRAASCCVVTEILFTLNMVLTAQNRYEVAAMVGLATRWGVRVCALAT